MIMKLGFIGAGNMAQAIMGGILKNGMVEKEEIIASDVSKTATDKVAGELGVHTTQDNKEAAKADILILAIKPVYCGEVIAEIKDVVREDQLIVTIVAGKSLEWLQEQFGRDLKIIRTMPNTPALVGAGITAICPNERVSSEEAENVRKLFCSFGEAEIVGEHLMDAVVAVSGSSPAYVFMFIEAMADAAVAEGMPRAQAYKFAAQAVLGSAKMVLETGKHPAELKDMVCSPAGTTIAAVRKLEEKGFRSSVMEAMSACAEISKKL